MFICNRCNNFFLSFGRGVRVNAHTTTIWNKWRPLAFLISSAVGFKLICGSVLGLWPAGIPKSIRRQLRTVHEIPRAQE